ncbi:MAG: dihydrofolate reductase [Parasporobacterium sp.]|nr:dihydrofolate reductase [Parasporobacterium sp.]
MRILVSADKNRGIGKNGKMLLSIPEDLRYARTTTAGKTVIMGRKTLENFPQNKPYPDRLNIVLSRNEDLKSNEDYTVCRSVEEALKCAEEAGNDIYIIGGESIFSQFIDYTDEVEMTYIDYSYDADAYFHDLDHDPRWVLTSESDEQTHFDIVYFYRQYTRRKDYEV